MDTQDGQDQEDERLRHEKRTQSVIGWALEVIHQPGSGFGGIGVGTQAMVGLKAVETLAE